MAPIPDEVSVLPLEKRVDDDSIKPDDLLWRLIDPDYIERDGAGSPVRDADGKLQFKSLALNTQELSVKVSTAVSLETVMRENPGIAIAELPAKAFRAEKCIIARDDKDRAHGLIYLNDGTRPPGDNDLGQKRARRLKKLARVIEPNEPLI